MESLKGFEQPDIIKYNLRDRGRKYRGVERNFNIPKIVATINSPACQERVKTRAMLGYFGHWPRLKFGLELAEGGIVNGVVQKIVPAIVTTHLKAYSDGTIEHKTEFLNTETGRIAAELYAEKIGGFSSVIDESKPEFYGFDWVNDPNYSTNRGYSLALDSVGMGEGMLSLDSIMNDELSSYTLAMHRLIEALTLREQLALDTASRLRLENEELVFLAATNQPQLEQKILTDKNQLATSQFERDTLFFDSSVQLPHLKVPQSKEAEKAHKSYNQLARRYNV